MEEQNQSQEQMLQVTEPNVNIDNSVSESKVQTEILQEPKEQAKENSELILGKFKSSEELSKAYQELEKLQGNQSAELGHLRGNAAQINTIQNVWKTLNDLRSAGKNLKEIANKHSSYFQDPSFRKMYRSAYLALGSNLDTDEFINLLEEYVSARIFSHDRDNSKKNETNGAINNLAFDKNEKTNSAPKINKRVEDMNPKEYEEFLQRLI